MLLWNNELEWKSFESVKTGLENQQNSVNSAFQHILGNTIMCIPLDHQLNPFEKKFINFANDSWFIVNAYLSFWVQPNSNQI